MAMEQIKEGAFVRLKSGTEGWIKGQIVEYTDVIPSAGGMIYTGPAYKVYILEGKHKGETIRVSANYVEPYIESKTKREPLYPHVLGKREPLFPHVPRGQQPEEMVRREGDWVYVKVGTTEVRGKKVPTGIDIRQVSPTFDQRDFDKAVNIIEKALE